MRQFHPSSLARVSWAVSQAPAPVPVPVSVLVPALARRELLRRGIVAGLAVAAAGAFGVFATACSESTDPSQRADLALGSEVGLLNFLYAVSQLEADFYERVNKNIYPGMTTDEFATFQTDQGVTEGERDALRTTVIPSGRITDVVLFRLGQTVDYSSRTSTLTHAQTIEDAAANGFAAVAASPLLKTSAATTQANAMQASALDRANGIRAMLGLAPLTVVPQAPRAVLTTLAPYYETTFTISG